MKFQAHKRNGWSDDLCTKEKLLLHCQRGVRGKGEGKGKGQGRGRGGAWEGQGEWQG